jgi:selenium metabolism protein YedF
MAGEEGGRTSAGETAKEEEDRSGAGKNGLIAVLSSNQMGTGDEELGRILMKGFVYALTKLEELPETILLYNGGAKLSVKGSETLEDLKNLETQGVEILTCGTCLNFYGLTDKLEVGSVTNMYEIVETMAGARRVIKP